MAQDLTALQAQVAATLVSEKSAEAKLDQLVAEKGDPVALQALVDQLSVSQKALDAKVASVS